MDAKQTIETSGKPIVYIRAVKPADLPEDVRAQVGDVTEVYAIMDADGGPVAIARDRAMAFSLARVNELAPVSVH